MDRLCGIGNDHKILLIFDFVHSGQGTMCLFIAFMSRVKAQHADPVRIALTNALTLKDSVSLQISIRIFKHTVIIEDFHEHLFTIFRHGLIEQRPEICNSIIYLCLKK